MVRGRAHTESVHKQLIHPNNCQRAFESSTATYTGDGKYYLVTKKKKKMNFHIQLWKDTLSTSKSL